MRSSLNTYTVHPGAAKFIACAALLFSAGCETATSPTDFPDPGPAPSANVGRIETWRDAEMLAAAGEGRSPAAGQGSSMAPVFGENTMLVIAPIAFEDLQPGMIVAYRNPRGFQVVHRLMEKTAAGDWRVRGLNNEREDAARVNAGNLLGVVYASLVHEEPDPPESAAPQAKEPEA